MTACSTYNNGATSLSKSLIHITRHEGYAISDKRNEEGDLVFDVIVYEQCDLCEGDPQCVKFCGARALEYLPKEAVDITETGRLAKRVIQFTTEAS
ncbi:hypothetical protein ES703_50479 [subsurface metagenome]